MIRHNNNYQANVLSELGRRSPSSSRTLYGAEIETSWASEGEREWFLERLTERKLDKLVISKHDGSVPNVSSEIVTAPMTPTPLAKTVGTIGAVLTEANTRVSTSNCGVHVHISRNPLTPAGRQLVFKAIMQDHTTGERVTGRYLNEDHITSEYVNNFWTTLALRAPTRYCTREWVSATTILGGQSSHGLAVTSGARTPTIELRIFKSTRSPKILRSYVQTASSLVAFAASIAPKTEEPVETVEEVRTPFFNELYALQWIDSFVGYFGSALRNAQRSEAFRDLQSCALDGLSHAAMADRLRLIRSVLSQADSYPTVAHWRAMTSPLMPPRSERRVSEFNWGERGYFPVQNYVKFVLDNKTHFPQLADRFTLERFEPYLPGAGVEVNESSFDTTEPHALVRVGCRVAQPHGRQDLVVRGLVSQARDEMPVATCVWEGYNRNRNTAIILSVEDLLHLCEGATSLETHGEG